MKDRLIVENQLIPKVGELAQLFQFYSGIEIVHSELVDELHPGNRMHFLTMDIF